ncbi:hypothetical protein CBOM_00672 [Ceraceosorus bombacis]|uniref:Uncharacterized protein n=1 Tax=Ceraceosorus bombacis TaxID=401625 RepID=A0A0P1BBH2_9BASI|nr:hypothetical protein CBOM_00672 [Ceraceosorus bombacis]
MRSFAAPLLLGSLASIRALPLGDSSVLDRFIEQAPSIVHWRDAHGKVRHTMDVKSRNFSRFSYEDRPVSMTSANWHPIYKNAQRNGLKAEGVTESGAKVHWDGSSWTEED